MVNYYHGGTRAVCKRNATGLQRVWNMPRLKMKKSNKRLRISDIVDNLVIRYLTFFVQILSSYIHLSLYNDKFERKCQIQLFIFWKSNLRMWSGAHMTMVQEDLGSILHPTPGWHLFGSSHLPSLKQQT
jgi:hypothetical protein